MRETNYTLTRRQWCTRGGGETVLSLSFGPKSVVESGEASEFYGTNQLKNGQVMAKTNESEEVARK